MGGAVFSKVGQLALLDFGIQGVGWALASALHTERFYDLTGSLTYWALTMRARSFASAEGKELSLRQQVCSACVLVWSLRLGSFLARRAWKHGDSRFDKVKHDPKMFFVYWFVQGVWCLITALPVYLQLSQPQDDAPLGITDYVSWAGWLTGFAMEVTADAQKSAWRAAGNTGFINTGLWKYSQHPNYFGEMCLWSSLCVSCLNSLPSAGTRVAALGSPAFVCYLLRYVSGVPLLQKAAKKKYGSDARYLDYTTRTSLLFPWLPKRKM